MFGRCPGCLAKENHISDLQKQVQTLTSLVYPRKSTGPSDIELEADHILNGSAEHPFIEDQSVDLEADSLLTGSYDLSQVEVE